ncbi:MAG: gliding motility-associated C-terminal domain-containing protein [Bacteroidales bacterium]|nr:gliding motility-associated C-terminal domain-containing protein [Bacteroidales bacterium]
MTKQVLISILILFTALNVNALEKDTLSFRKAAFIENKNQWPEQVLYKAPISTGNLWIERNTLTFDLKNPDDIKAIADYKSQAGTNMEKGIPFPSQVRHHIYKVHFIGANSEVKTEAHKPYDYYENYIIGNDKHKWASNVKTYQSIKYLNLYQGIDLKLYQQEGFLKWDFIVEPHALANSIVLEYEGVDKLSIQSGKLIIKTSVNKIIEMAPYSYQIDNDGNHIDVACQYHLEENQLTFHFPNGYNPEWKLVIDPVLIFGSYSGSTSDNWGYSATFDSQGYLFAGGSSFGNGYPYTTGALDTTFSGGSCDIVISKYDTNGTQLIYSTYLGGSNSEVPSSLIVNSNDELFVMGVTGSSDFPVSPSGYDTSFNGGTGYILTSAINFSNGSDIFITRLNSTGTQIIASTFFGGTGNDGLNTSTSLLKNYADELRGEIVIDKNNNPIIVSSTISNNIPITFLSFQSSNAGGQDGMVAKFDNNLSNLIWSSYYGGSASDAIYSVAVDQNQDIYITGGTSSLNLNTTFGALHTNYQGGLTDGFIAKINSNGSNLIHNSYFGTPAYDQSYFIDLDKFDNAYVFGQTSDTGSTLIYNALWNSPGDGQFITKLDPQISNILWSTTWGNGTTGVDVSPSAFMVDLCNRIYLSAWGGLTNGTWSTTNGLPISNNAFQSTTDGSDYYVMVMKDDASGLDYGTFYGGAQSHEHVDGGTSRFDHKGRIYQAVCAGCGGHSDFPTTTNAHSNTNNSSNCNNGVFKFDFDIPAIVADFVQPPVGCAPDTIDFNNTSYLTHPATTSFLWDFGDGTSSNLHSPSHIYTQSGIYFVTLIINDNQSCNLSDTIVQQIAMLSGSIDTIPSKSICKFDFTQIGILPINDPSVLYHWTNASALSDTTVSNPIAFPLADTWYNMAITNGQCTDTLRQFVKVYDIDVFAGNDTSLCQGIITLTAQSNSPNLQFQWSSSSNFNDTLNTSTSDSTLTVSVSGPTYFYIRAFWQGCGDIDSVLVDVRIHIQQQNIQHPLCHNDANGYIDVIATGGLSPYIYSWDNGMNGNQINNLGGGTYVITVTDADGCFTKDTVALINPPLLTSSKAKKNIPCAQACIGEAWCNPTGGTPPYTWQWNDPSNQTTNPATQLCDGTFIVQLKDANNCSLSDTVVLIDSSIYITFNAWNDDTIYQGQTVPIHSSILNGNYSYLWTPNTGLDNPTSNSCNATPDQTTTYFVEVHDQWGCTWRDSVTIWVLDVVCDEPYIYVPNAFTPNNDGKNDVLFVKSNVAYEVDFRIYDRWGELVFETTNLDNGWNGTFRGQNANPGVFVYHLVITCYNKEIFRKKGNITLIR